MVSGRVSGSTLPKLFALYDRASSSWKTWLRSGRVASTSSPKTWPRSGMTSGGHAFELPTNLSASPTTGTAGSVSQLPLFPTPTARDWKSGAGAEALRGRNSRPLSEVVLYLKPPTANLGRNGAPQHPEKHKAGGHGPTLDDEVSYILPDADADGVQDWGDFEPAIRRQEEATGLAAPFPTEVGPRGGRRLAARFAEWLMGLPRGWVTDVPGLSRADQLRAIGNGVAPAQAYEAYRRLLDLQVGDLPVQPTLDD